MRTAFFLRNVPVLAGMSDELLERLAEQVREVRLPAGSWIMREGDLAESMFIVGGGRIEVVHEGPPEILLRVLRRGDVLGELVLLREGVRAASARAQRDTELLELERADFESLIEHAPSFALGLTRAMGAQIAASRSPVVPAIPPRTIAIVGLDRGSPAAEVGETLAGALSAHGATARLRSGDLATIDQAERDTQRVVLVAPGPPEDEWTRLCLSEADVVLAVTVGAPDQTWMTHVRALRGCELFVLGGPVAAGTIEELQPREVQLVADSASRQAALESTARRMAGRALGIVLSGGGARALAHIGVLEELTAAGIQIDRVAGVSMGAFVGALFAMGLDADEMDACCFEEWVQRRPLSDYTIPRHSLIRGERFRSMLDRTFGQTMIEELPRSYMSGCTELRSGRLVIARQGLLREAVGFSICLPILAPPQVRGREIFIDGSLVDNLPVGAMAELGEGPVIAVDVKASFERAPATRSMTHNGTGTSADGSGIAAGRSQTRRPPNIGETLTRVLLLGSANTSEAASRHADMVITPRAEGVGLLEFHQLDAAREAGRAAAQEALEKGSAIRFT